MKRSFRQKYACYLNVFSENYELLYNVKAHVEKRTGKKNGSYDLVDLGNIRLIRRSNEKSTWPGVP